MVPEKHFSQMNVKALNLGSGSSSVFNTAAENTCGAWRSSTEKWSSIILFPFNQNASAGMKELSHVPYHLDLHFGNKYFISLVLVAVLFVESQNNLSVFIKLFNDSFFRIKRDVKQ